MRRHVIGECHARATRGTESKGVVKRHDKATKCGAVRSPRADGQRGTAKYRCAVPMRASCGQDRPNCEFGAPDSAAGLPARCRERSRPTAPETPSPDRPCAPAAHQHKQMGPQCLDRGAEDQARIAVLTDSSCSLELFQRRGKRCPPARRGAEKRARFQAHDPGPPEGERKHRQHAVIKSSVTDRLPEWDAIATKSGDASGKPTVATAKTWQASALSETGLYARRRPRA